MMAAGTQEALIDVGEQPAARSSGWEIIFNPNGPHGPHPIYTVAAYKGGVGKTEISYELAYLLNAIFIDVDWDKGGATRKWGYVAEDRQSAPLLDAVESGRTPKFLKGRMKADLVPSHPDMFTNQPDPMEFAQTMKRWAKEWNRPVVVDTHPGGNNWSFGAMAASNVVIVPSPLKAKEMEALDGMVRELADYPLLLAPNMVTKSPPPFLLTKLEKLAKGFNLPVGTPISDQSTWLPKRTRRMAVAASDPIPVRAVGFVEELKELAREVTQYNG